MTTQPTLDKTGWGQGPWLEEPDRDVWVHAALTCYLQRGPLGALCGYVGVPIRHPLHGAGYDDDDVDNIQVHGGLTFAGQWVRPDLPPGLWFFGFDCGHYMDVTPALHVHYSSDGVYRTYAYVVAQTNTLAEQLRDRIA